MGLLTSAEGRFGIVAMNRYKPSKMKNIAPIITKAFSSSTCRLHAKELIILTESNLKLRWPDKRYIVSPVAANNSRVNQELKRQKAQDENDPTKKESIKRLQ